MRASSCCLSPSCHPWLSLRKRSMPFATWVIQYRHPESPCSSELESSYLITVSQRKISRHTVLTSNSLLSSLHSGQGSAVLLAWKALSSSDTVLCGQLFRQRLFLRSPGRLLFQIRYANAPIQILNSIGENIPVPSRPKTDGARVLPPTVRQGERTEVLLALISHGHTSIRSCKSSLSFGT